MHTFFINTSGNELDDYSDIFEIQHETRRLVSLDCPLSDWNVDGKGYVACVKKMEELIDNYKDINNVFNLIIYVDLLSYCDYTSIPMNNHRERYACLRALRSIIKHYIGDTIVNEMIANGRNPKEILLIFEENQLPKDGDETTEYGKSLIRTYAKKILGIPAETERIDEILYKTDADKKCISPDEFCKAINGCKSSCLGNNLLNSYLDYVDTFISEAESYDSSEQPMIQLLDRIVDCSYDDDKTIASVTFVTNRQAGKDNKQEKTRRNLRLCFYILSCVEEGTLCEQSPADKEGFPCAREFPDIDWENVATELSAKAATLRRKYNETQRLSESFSDLNLAPSLYAFDNQRFALDEFGKRGKVFDVVDVGDNADGEQEAKDAENGVVRSKGRKAVVVKDANARSLFSKDEYPIFNYKGDEFVEGKLGLNTTPEKFVAEAQRLRQHHLDYLQRLNVHISDRLSNYSGRSAENDPALLRKRRVSVAEEDFEDQGRDYRYVKPGRPEETKKLKTVKGIADTAYTSALLDYMEFCASRSVAVTDIEEQCNWFVTMIGQIKESLRKLKIVAIGLLVAVVVLYLPFVIIQWESLVRHVTTVTVALLSVAIPIVLLYLIFAIAAVIQKRKYYKAWKEFKKNSDRALEENAIAAEKYDQLLSIYVPTLRWVYEYRLDVEFYEDCCKMARAKLGHHSQKLHDRVVTIGNIIEDLEESSVGYGGSTSEERNNTGDEIDYNVSFCTGKKNRKLYSIIDAQFLKSLQK